MNASQVEKATRGHTGMYDVQGHYLGGCACGLECSAVELIDHIDEIIRTAQSPSAPSQQNAADSSITLGPEAKC